MFRYLLFIKLKKEDGSDMDSVDEIIYLNQISGGKYLLGAIGHKKNPNDFMNNY